MASSDRIWRAVGIPLRLVLGAVFVYAAWVKLREPWELFALAISSYQVVSLKGAEVVARTLPWLEMAVGALLIAGLVLDAVAWLGRGGGPSRIAGLTLRVSAPVTSVLLLAFFSLIVRAWAKGLEISCGCFSNDEPISRLTILRDGSMLAGSLLLTALAFRRPKSGAEAHSRGAH